MLDYTAMPTEGLKARLDSHPNDAMARFWLGVRLLSEDQFANALEQLEQCPADELISKYNYQIYLVIADCLFGLERFQEACDSYFRALAQNFEIARLHSRLTELSLMPEVQMPRPERSPNILVDTRFDFVGPPHVPSQFRLRILETDDGVAVIATWDEKSFGKSITNAAETIANLVVKAYDFNLATSIWVEHRENSLFDNGPTISRVLFQINSNLLPSDGKPSFDSTSAVWEDLSFEEFEALTGLRLYWKPLPSLPATAE